MECMIREVTVSSRLLACVSTVGVGRGVGCFGVEFDSTTGDTTLFLSTGGLRIVRDDR
jgi:hypothetical protein